jgi:hypothetical protein
MEVGELRMETGEVRRIGRTEGYLISDRWRLMQVTAGYWRLECHSMVVGKHLRATTVVNAYKFW